jgi:non-homologous end joining protein Ku
MPRAGWNGFLRLSLVTCRSISLPLPPRASASASTSSTPSQATGWRQQLIDAETGEIVERDRIAKGYEYSRGQYVLVEDDELKSLQIESARSSST